MTKFSSAIYKSYPQGRAVPYNLPANIPFSCLIVDNFTQTGSKTLFFILPDSFFPVRNHHRTVVNLTDSDKYGIRFFLPFLLQ